MDDIATVSKKGTIKAIEHIHSFFLALQLHRPSPDSDVSLRDAILNNGLVTTQRLHEGMLESIMFCAASKTSLGYLPAIQGLYRGM